MAGIAVLDHMQRDLMTQPKVRGIIIIQNHSQLPVRTTLPKQVAATISGHVMKIIPKARSALQEVDPHDSLQFFRVRGRNFEYIVYCEDIVTMVTVQEHTTLELDGEASGAMKMVMHDPEGNENARNQNQRIANVNRLELAKQSKKFNDTDKDFLHINFLPR